MRLIITPHSSKSVRAGVEIFSDQLHRALPESEIRTLDDAKPPGAMESCRFNFFRDVWAADRLCSSALESNGAQWSCVLANGLWGHPFEEKKTKIPLISIQHGTFAGYAQAALPFLSPEFLRTSMVFAHFEKKAALQARRVVSNSAFTQMLVKKHYGVDSRVIENAVDWQSLPLINSVEARKKLHLPLEKKIVLFVGRQHEGKGFDRLEALARHGPDWDFMAVVPDPRPTRLENLKLVGPVDRDTLAAYYGACDCVYWPTRFEGFGFVPLEALACNRPVVGSKTGIFWNESLEGFFPVEHHDPKTLRGLMEDAFSRKWDTREKVARRFSMEKFAREYQAVVNEYG